MAQNQPFTLRSVLESNKLNETNYTDWIRNLRIVLRAANKQDVLITHCQRSLLQMPLLLRGMLTGERLIKTVK